MDIATRFRENIIYRSFVKEWNSPGDMNWCTMHRRNNLVIGEVHEQKHYFPTKSEAVEKAFQYVYCKDLVRNIHPHPMPTHYSEHIPGKPFSAIMVSDPMFRTIMEFWTAQFILPVKDSKYSLGFTANWNVESKQWIMWPTAVWQDPELYYLDCATFVVQLSEDSSHENLIL